MKTKTNNKDLLRESILKASQTKKAVEEIIRAQLLESLSPSVRNVLNSSLAEMDDFDAEDLDENAEEEVVDFEETPEEEVVADEFSEEEVVEEGEDVSSDEEEFLRELQSVLESDDEEITPDEEEVVTDEEVIEENEKSDDDEDLDKVEEANSKGGEENFKKVVSENKKLRREIDELKKGVSEISKMLSESSLDVKRTDVYNRILKLTRLSETQKLRVMKQLDKANSITELKKLEESYSALFRKAPVKKVASKKVNGGSTQIKSLSENATRKPSTNIKTTKVLSESLSRRLAELADIQTK
jgi:hypothetical protein